MKITPAIIVGGVAVAVTAAAAYYFLTGNDSVDRTTQISARDKLYGIGEAVSDFATGATRQHLISREIGQIGYRNLDLEAEEKRSLEAKYGEWTASKKTGGFGLSEVTESQYGKWTVEQGSGVYAPVKTADYVDSSGAKVQILRTQGQYVEERYTPAGSNRSFIRAVQNPSYTGGGSQNLTTAEKQRLYESTGDEKYL